MRHSKLLRSRTIRPVVPTASMADIAFLLIIFFMLTTSFSPERTSVELPDSQIRSEVKKDAAIVAVTADGRILFTTGEENSVPLASVTELGQQVQAITTVIPEKQFVIKADRLAQYQDIDKVLDELRSNGALNIGMLTDQKIENF